MLAVRIYMVREICAGREGVDEKGLQVSVLVSAHEVVYGVRCVAQRDCWGGW